MGVLADASRTLGRALNKLDARSLRIRIEEKEQELAELYDELSRVERRIAADKDGAGA